MSSITEDQNTHCVGKDAMTLHSTCQHPTSHLCTLGHTNRDMTPTWSDNVKGHIELYT